MMNMIRMGLVLMMSCSALAQDAASYFKVAEEKSYTPRQRGLKDLVVELENPQLTKQLNEQMIFGRLNQVSFRIYWTAEPERVAIEVLGLPEGFREIKEELKGAMIGRFESVIPLSLEKKFQGYQLKTDTSKPRSVMAVDTSHQRAVPEYELVFDAEGKLLTLIARKPVGLVTTHFSWSKANWSDPRQHLSRVKTMAEEGPQITEIDIETSWSTQAGIGLPSIVKTRTKQTLRPAVANAKPIERTIDETLQFKNYKVNTGAAMKWFLGHSSPTP